MGKDLYKCIEVDVQVDVPEADGLDGPAIRALAGGGVCRVQEGKVAAESHGKRLGNVGQLRVSSAGDDVHQHRLQHLQTEGKFGEWVPLLAPCFPQIQEKVLDGLQQGRIAWLHIEAECIFDSSGKGVTGILQSAGCKFCLTWKPVDGRHLSEEQTRDGRRG